MATALEKSIVIPIPKIGNAKEHSKYQIIASTSHASKVMLKILQTGLQQYMNWELLDIQVGFSKDRGTKDQITNICWIIEEASKFQKIKLKKKSASLTTLIFLWVYCFFWSFVDHNKPWKVLNEMGVLDHLTNLLRNLYAGQEATVWTRLGTMDWFKIGKGVREGCILSLCLFNLYAEYIMWNAVLNEAEAE